MRLLLRAVRVIVSRHRVALAIGAALVAAIAFWLSRPRHGNWTEPYAGADIGPDDALHPRAILGRVWFARMSNDPYEVLDMWLFLGGGCGFHEQGATWGRWTTEVFLHERQNDRIVIDPQQNEHATASAFTIERCDHAPFDLCLTFEMPLAGSEDAVRVLAPGRSARAGSPGQPVQRFGRAANALPLVRLTTRSPPAPYATRRTDAGWIPGVDRRAVGAGVAHLPSHRNDCVPTRYDMCSTQLP
jgi:hypothetical protein